jgi:predicted metalloprotease
MEWRGRRQSGNIEDRRGAGGMGGFGGQGPRINLGFPGGGGRGGGLGIGAVVVILVIGWIAGINPLELLGGLEGGGGPSSLGGPTSTQQSGQQSGQMGAPTVERGEFVATILADTEDVWTELLPKSGVNYEPPTLVLFTNSTQSACGFASQAAGPFYCPGDHKVYIDLGFYDELANRFQAPGDFAEAYVIAHEIGHHVQNLLGILPKVDKQRQAAGETEANALSVRLELQADCFAGIWAQQEEKRGVLEVGDIDEALNAASQIGDDTLQKESQGYVVPDSFTHGTSAQRSRWFKRGYNQGDISSCDTFAASDL